MPKNLKTQKTILKENNELQAFLNDRRTASDNKGSFTHTSIDAPKGSYNIPTCELDVFLDLYYKIGQSKGLPNTYKISHVYAPCAGIGVCYYSVY